MSLSLPLAAAAQSKTAPKPAGAVSANSTDQFLMKDGAVVLRQGTKITPLTKNVQLANGTKVNYKSGIVELPVGKMTTLREGDYVTMQGDIVFATPASAAAARGDNSVPATAQYQQYIDRDTPSSAAEMESRLTSLNSKITLMAQKIQLLNDKISLLSSGQRPANTTQIDQQLKALDQQLSQVK
ncbi:DUF6799 domain-containing protein [Hymenobacter sp. BT491]|uniref:DUF6799 domain-containing protein n=1 Tax=Hymenobacter sp. BT491 TaxID=2766779 RepID=UPI001653BBD4|nr:DUF6799 domain-containing protein [Hymenobacter sp. BT491]MBC6988482.1 hypothetical protein [Hymenobacter sp. BT491]